MNLANSLCAVAVAVIVLLTAVSSAEDDTHGCLSTYDGPLVVKSGTFDETGFIRPGSLVARTRYDLREATFLKTNLNAVVFLTKDVPNIPVCVAGGTIIGTQSRDMSWSDSHAGNCAMGFYGQNSTIDGVRGDNIANDFISVSASGTKDFVIKNNWASYVRDDCVENDSHHSGVIEDNLVDGCYVFLSHQDECTNCDTGTRVQVRRNLIHMHDMPYPYKPSWETVQPEKGYGPLFKQANGANDPDIDFVENVVWFEPNSYRPSYAPNVKRFTECKDNVLIWTGSGDWPDTSWENLPSGALKAVYRGQEGKDVWNAIKQNWIDCHPDVAHVSGDPESHPSQCDENAYGGGGTITHTLPDATALLPEQRRGQAMRAVDGGHVEIYGLDGRRLGRANNLRTAAARLPGGLYMARIGQSEIIRTFSGGHR